MLHILAVYHFAGLNVRVALTIEDLNKDLLPKRTVRAGMLLVLAFRVGQLDYENDPTLLSLSFLTIYRDQDVLAELDPLD